MNRFASRLALLLIMLLPVQSVCAWSGPGHMIVAAVAYLNLNPQERQKAADILKLHYNYEKWKAEVPDKDAVLEEGIVLFMGASKWPDEIKFGNSTWNHKEWHFVDYPLTPLDFSLKPSPSPEDDIIFAIKRCQTKLEDPKVSAKEKAYWLPWLIHIVGDITQPLHCCALVNDDFAGPIGDRGGNSIFVKAGTGKGVTLHKMWDDATGTSKGFHTKLLRGYVNQAIELGSKFKRDGLAELKQHTTPEAWARESWQIAVDQVYLRGKLQYGKDVASAVPLPDGYTKNLKAISLRRVTLGGYRLADLIRECLK